MRLMLRCKINQLTDGLPKITGPLSAEGETVVSAIVISVVEGMPQHQVLPASKFLKQIG